MCRLFSKINKINPETNQSLNLNLEIKNDAPEDEHMPSPAQSSLNSVSSNEKISLFYIFPKQLAAPDIKAEQIPLVIYEHICSSVQNTKVISGVSIHGIPSEHLYHTLDEAYLHAEYTDPLVAYLEFSIAVSRLRENPIKPQLDDLQNIFTSDCNKILINNKNISGESIIETIGLNSNLLSPSISP